MRHIRLAVALSVALTLAITETPLVAQSQAINGTIEGTVLDTSSAVLPGVTVTVTNTETGAERVVVTNESGLYRAPLLPLGVYRVSAELSGFKKFEQIGVVVSAGQSAVINVTLEVGQLTEVISVTSDSPVVDLGKIDQGRTLNEREIKTLPLTSRNPYNFALLQPGVVGFETQEFGVPRLTANGALLRVNYQIDGNTNTQKDRAGLRQMPMSEVMIREVKVVTTGYAPEFGQTMGLIYNAITPAGTNLFKGQGSYRFQRKSFAAFPFFFQGERTDARKPTTKVDVVTVDLGGPVILDRAHFFGGFENTRRDLSGGRVITIAQANQQRLGLSEPPAIPAELDTKFAIGKLDYQINQVNRFTARYIFFDNFITDNIGNVTASVPNSVQQGTDFSDRQHSFAAQVVSTIRSNLLNEARVQYATREQGRVPGSLAGTGPAIRIPGVANFGGPIATNTDAGFGFQENVFQVLNNTTWLRGNHSYKVGGDIQWIDDQRTQASFQLYTFPTIDAYLAAVSGANPLGYTSLQQFFGDPNLDFNSSLYGLFAQDDWRVRPNIKLLYGIRYDVYDVPAASTSAPVASSRDFQVDRNNWQPRAGVVWTVDDSQRTVLRANMGLMYDQVLLASYERALLEDGTTTRAAATLQPGTAGAPAFPNVLASGTGAQPNTASTVDPNFSIARTWQNNVQLERSISESYAVGVGFTYVKGYDLPVINNINLINPTGSLSDGRPIFSRTIGADTRVDPRYNVINSVESVGESTYKALTLQATRRFSQGMQFDVAYTLGKSEDNAPITSVLSVQGDTGGRSDPTNLDRDKGPHILDQRHTLTGSIVWQPTFDIESKALSMLASNNQLGVALLFASGIPVNVRSNQELNNDNIGSDRPLGVGRNSLNLPARYNVDLRYSRLFSIGWRAKAEIVAELKNLFNTVQWASVNSVVTTDLLGNAQAPIPTEGRGFPASGGYEQRQFQLGFKVQF